MLLGDEKATIILGHFGSGKSEVAVNLAFWAKTQAGKTVALADLDLVNPYFRSREAAPFMEAQGIELILPESRYLNADLPILVPAVRSLLMAGTAYGIFDIGGDAMGARVLGSLTDALTFAKGNLRLLLVVNSYRPFSSDMKSCLKIQKEIEQAARTRITGYISNAHLMEETRVGTIMEGLALVEQLAGTTGLPLEFLTAPLALADEVSAQCKYPVLPVGRHLLPPWLQTQGTNLPLRVKPLFAT